MSSQVGKWARPPLYVRFMKKVQPEPNSGCWFWLGGINSYGYGNASTFGTAYTLAHRLSYCLHVASIPDGLMVLHRCDMPLCVNPDHLFTGTQADNMRDMDLKDRRRNSPSYGEDHGMAQLTRDQVMAIRKCKESSGKMAPLYGISAVHFNRIRRRAAWKHVQ